MKTKELLNERNNTHGPFTGNARVAQELKQVLQLTPSYYKMHDVHREALEMICHKIARIVNGDPTFDDHWDDIAGYALLPKKFNHGKDD
jgi:hypothetical protein